MGEYQYYEFRAMGRALTKAEIAELRSISTRAAITSTSFTNHYEWGDLKANPLKLLEKYFDAFVYITNWGTREFYLRLPRESVDYELFRTTLPGDAASVRRAGDHLIVGFEDESEPEDWDEGTGWMGSLMSLRSDLLCGANKPASIHIRASAKQRAKQRDLLFCRGAIVDHARRFHRIYDSAQLPDFSQDASGQIGRFHEHMR